MDTTSSQTPMLPMRGGTRIPQLGFGVFQIPPQDTAAAVAEALRAGYRHIDTAAAYRNEAGVAEAIRASGLEREDVFVTTKCFNTNHGHDEALQAFDRSVERMGFDHVDLYLIHWPVPSRDRYVETWTAFIELRTAGRARSIGVSNFKPDHLHRVIEETGEAPAINQVELHPYLQQRELRRLHEELGILTEAWSPLAQGLVLEDPVIVAIAESLGRTPGQVVLRWHLQLGNVVIPKSATPARIRENFEIFDFELEQEAMERIAALDRGERTGPDPDTFVLP